MTCGKCIRVSRRTEMKNIEDDYFPILEIIQGIDMHESNSSRICVLTHAIA